MVRSFAESGHGKAPLLRRPRVRVALARDRDGLKNPAKGTGLGPSGSQQITFTPYRAALRSPKAQRSRTTESSTLADLRETAWALQFVPGITAAEWLLIKELHAYTDGSGGTPKAGDEAHPTWAVVIVAELVGGPLGTMMGVEASDGQIVTERLILALGEDPTIPGGRLGEVMGASRHPVTGKREVVAVLEVRRY